MTYRPVPFVAAFLREYAASPDQTIVDVGCGPALYRDASPARYVGVDERADSYGAASSVDVVAAAEDMPFDDASVSVVMTLAALYQFADPDAALQEFKRILRPGGRVLLVDYNRRAQRRLERIEGAPRPRWTALALRRRVHAAGFENPRLLLPVERQPEGLKRVARLVHEELRGQWAIVTATRPVP